jgi:hypothetical protein
MAHKKAFVRYAQNKVVAGSLILSDKAPKVGVWKEIPYDLCCQPGSCDASKLNLEQLLSNMSVCYEQVTNLFPTTTYFTDYGNGSNTSIDNGCGDMYDGGNSFNTNLTQPYSVAKWDNLNFNLSIPYTHTQDNSDANECDYTNPPMDGQIVSGAGYFNIASCSKYFTNMYPGFFMLAATGVNVTQFGIYGNLGSDGQAISQAYTQLTNYPDWTVFLKTNNDNDGTGDPNVTHITLVYGNVDDVIHAVDTNGDWDDDVLAGLGPQNSAIISIVFATENGQPVIDINNAVSIGNRILDVYSGGCL